MPTFLNGVYVEYYEDVKTSKRKTKYLNKKKHGFEYLYYPNGKLKGENLYMDDDIIYEKSYDENGQIILEKKL